METQPGIFDCQNSILRHDINGVRLDAHVVFRDLDRHVGLSITSCSRLFARAEVRDDSECHAAVVREPPEEASRKCRRRKRRYRRWEISEKRPPANPLGQGTTMRYLRSLTPIYLRRWTQPSHFIARPKCNGQPAVADGEIVILPSRSGRGVPQCKWTCGISRWLKTRP